MLIPTDWRVGEQTRWGKESQLLLSTTGRMSAHSLADRKREKGRKTKNKTLHIAFNIIICLNADATYRKGDETVRDREERV